MRGWRPVAAFGALLATVPFAMPAFCVTGIARRRNAGFSDDLVYLDHRVAAVIGVPLMVMAPVGGWMVVARREAR